MEFLNILSILEDCQEIVSQSLGIASQIFNLQELLEEYEARFSLYTCFRYLGINW